MPYTSKMIPAAFCTRKLSNQAMQRTQHFVATAENMRTLILKVLGG
jgi:hypothetical protein